VKKGPGKLTLSQLCLLKTCGGVIQVLLCLLLSQPGLRLLVIALLLFTVLFLLLVLLFLLSILPFLSLGFLRALSPFLLLLFLQGGPLFEAGLLRRETLRACREKITFIK